MMGRKRLKIDSGAVIKTVCKAERYQLDKVLIAFIIFGKQYKVIITAVVFFLQGIRGDKY